VRGGRASFVAINIDDTGNFARFKCRSMRILLPLLPSKRILIETGGRRARIPSARRLTITRSEEAQCPTVTRSTRQNAPGPRLSTGPLTPCWASIPQPSPSCFAHSPGQYAPCAASQPAACPPGERACVRASRQRKLGRRETHIAGRIGSASLPAQSGSSIGPMSANTSPGPGLSGWVRPPR
jgi:hypothetical protein